MAAEKNYENKIKKYLTDRGHWVLKYWAGSQYTKSGIPDLLCCINGYFVAIEVKAEKGKLSPLQEHQIGEIHKAGGEAIALRPSEWGEFLDLVAYHENLPAP